MDLLELLLEPLSYDFMVRAIVTTALAAVVCVVLSCWLVLIGWSLMGDAVSHAVLPGVVLAYIVGAPFALGALALIAVGVVVVPMLSSRDPLLIQDVLARRLVPPLARDADGGWLDRFMKGAKAKGYKVPAEMLDLVLRDATRVTFDRDAQQRRPRIAR